MNLPRFALAATLVLATSGLAEAMPLANVGLQDGSLVQNVATVVTKTVRTGPFGSRMMTRRMMRRGPMGGRSVTVTKTVR